MCLIVPFKNNKPKVAKEDITIYKILEEIDTDERYILRSPYHEFEYAKNLRQPEVKLSVKRLNSSIGVSCSGESAEKFLIKRYGMEWYSTTSLGQVKYGYHAYTVLEVALVNVRELVNMGWEDSLRVFEGIIPKGATYIESEYGEIVGSTIIVLRDVTIEENENY